MLVQEPLQVAREDRHRLHVVERLDRRGAHLAAEHRQLAEDLARAEVRERDRAPVRVLAGDARPALLEHVARVPGVALAQDDASRPRSVRGTATRDLLQLGLGQLGEQRHAARELGRPPVPGGWAFGGGESGRAVGWPGGGGRKKPGGERGPYQGQSHQQPEARLTPRPRLRSRSPPTAPGARAGHAAGGCAVLRPRPACRRGSAAGTPPATRAAPPPRPPRISRADTHQQRGAGRARAEGVMRREPAGAVADGHAADRAGQDVRAAEGGRQPPGGYQPRARRSRSAPRPRSRGRSSRT